MNWSQSVGAEQSRSRSVLRRMGAVGLLGAALLAACGGDDDEGGGGGAALFAIATGVSAGDSTTTYVKTLPALDVDQKIDLARSLEAPGFGDAASIGGKLYVSSPETPVVRRFVVDEQGGFKADGEVNFGAYSMSANIYEQGFVSPTQAYLSADKKWVRWNPSTLTIEKTIDFPAKILEKREGLDAHISYDRGFVVRGNRIYSVVSWSDVTNHKMAATSAIVVLDATTDAVLDVVDAPCPFLDVGTKDDAGNIYFSGWVYSPGATLVNGGAKSCAVKVPVGSDTIDPAWTLQMASITGGHEASALTYIGSDTFLLATFHEEKSPFNPATMKIDEWIFAASWRYGTYNQKTKEYKELPDLGWHSGGYYSARLDGQFYLLTPGANYDSTTYFQLNADGSSKKGISMDGWSTRAFKLR